MALLDTASLIVTPNGYKASKLYSIVPSDGTGDMTFSRTGNTATRVNSSGLIETVNANIPRLDYLGSTCPKLLMEPQRTNLLTYSSSIGDANTTKTYMTATSDTSVLPDGNTSGYKLTGNSGSSIKHIYKTYVTSTTGTYTLSYFVKYVDEQYVLLRINDQTGVNDTKQTYDILNGTLFGSIVNVGTAVGSNSKIEAYANGWYRISLTGTFIGTITQLQCQCWLSVYGATTKTTSFLVYGAQLEAGAFATSYIPTTTASVTRNVDNCSKSSASALIGQTEGTLFFDFKVNSQNGNSTYFGITSGSFTNYVLIGKEASVSPNKILFGIRGSGTTVFNETSTALNGNFNRCAIAYKSGNYAAYFNGTLVASGTSSITFNASLNLFGFGANSTFTLNDEKLEIKSAAIWNTRLTNTELAQLTTL